MKYNLNLIKKYLTWKNKDSIKETELEDSNIDQKVDAKILNSLEHLVDATRPLAIDKTALIAIESFRNNNKYSVNYLAAIDGNLTESVTTNKGLTSIKDISNSRIILPNEYAEIINKYNLKLSVINRAAKSINVPILYKK